jgi:hypothetical protein
LATVFTLAGKVVANVVSAADPISLHFSPARSF